MSRHVLNLFVSAFLFVSASLVVGCAADVAGTSADDGDAMPAASAEASADLVGREKTLERVHAKGEPGSACDSAEECTGFVCPDCSSFAKYCTGAHVCATEEETCGAISCSDADAH